MTGLKFPLLKQLERIIERFGEQARTEVIEQIYYKGHEFPIHCITLGSTEPDVPVLAFFGGVHGLEKIGSEVILSYMETISQLLDWDEEFLTRLEKSRLVFLPLVNPVGVYLGTRSNGNGVDLMRNSPVEGVGATRIYSGQRHHASFALVSRRCLEHGKGSAGFMSCSRSTIVQLAVIDRPGFTFRFWH